MTWLPGACRAVVDYVRAHGPAHLSATAMSPPIAEQIMAALDLIQGKDGSTRGAEKLQSLQDNAVYFRQALQKMGCIVLGTGTSPIVVSQQSKLHITLSLRLYSFLLASAARCQPSRLQGMRVQDWVDQLHMACNHRSNESRVTAYDGNAWFVDMWSHAIGLMDPAGLRLLKPCRGHFVWGGLSC